MPRHCDAPHTVDAPVSPAPPPAPRPAAPRSATTESGRPPGRDADHAPRAQPAVPSTPLARYRLRCDRPGLALRAGETVLAAVYEPAALGLVVLVRCEADGHAPGALLPARDLELLEHTDHPARPGAWSVPGLRA
ncbi:hypothetical protein AS188_10635 [Kocuria flava]|uniref:DUF35 domain-containing protein n=1 Tax=Kocuria flava TaxID=446860 RepID=A0A0U3I9P1_9MICC|nr:hypothetical protein [Kocuria flava]ALU40124.1 hypothetical protein AS188_10635 [Kocuria flava]GEO91039.1 hypothetical protein KFL01_03450 [Kocuria flava]